MIDVFGVLPNGDPVHRVVLANDVIKVALIGFGAAIQSLNVRSDDPHWTNIVLGLTDLESYVTKSPHFGATPGRYAGRIDHGRFDLDGTRYQLAINRPPHTIHGGVNGFGKRNWTIVDHGDSHVIFSLFSPDGEEGFPGNVTATLRYSLDGRALRLDFNATADRPTIINLTNHSYFNLGGEGSGDVFGHLLHIPASSYYPIRPDGVPTGSLAPVDNSPFDFRTPRTIGSRIRDVDEQLRRAKGYDHALFIPGQGLRIAAVLTHPETGRSLTVRTTQPVIQLYTANTLDGTLAGPSNRLYRSGDAVCLEAEHPQDAPNHSNFPSTTLLPDAPFKATTIFECGGSLG